MGNQSNSTELDISNGMAIIAYGVMVVYGFAVGALTTWLIMR